MARSNFSKDFQQFREREQQKLLEVLKFHNNAYTWYDTDDKDEMDYDDYESVEVGELQLPSVTILPYYGYSYEMIVCEIWANKQGKIFLTGIKKDSDDLDFVDCSADEVALGHLDFLARMIPQTPDEPDVPQNDFEVEYPVFSLYRSDLSVFGYDASQVNDATMEKIAKHLSESYRENLLRLELETIAEYYQIPKL